VKCGPEACASSRLGLANALLIEDDEGLTLNDAGFPRKEPMVFGAIRGHGRSAVVLDF
jgi:hypothetical protein